MNTLSPAEDRTEKVLGMLGKVLPTLMNWAVAALIAYMALSDRMARLEAGSGLDRHRIAALEEQVRTLAIDSKRTLEVSVETRTILEAVRDQLRDERRR